MITLLTRDGRKVGNGIVYAVSRGNFFVETDFGNTMRLTRGELEELYYFGEAQPYVTWRQAKGDARGDRGNSQEKVSRISELSEWVYENTDTLEGILGAEVSYLLAAIAKGESATCDYCAGDQIVRLLRGGEGYRGVTPLPPDHWVWSYITISNEE